MFHGSEAEDPDVDMQIIQALLGGGFGEPTGARTAVADAAIPQGEVLDFEALLFDAAVAATDLSADLQGDLPSLPLQQAEPQPDLSVSPKVFLSDTLSTKIIPAPASVRLAVDTETKLPPDSVAEVGAVDVDVKPESAIGTEILQDAMDIVPLAKGTDRAALSKPQFEQGEIASSHQEIAGLRADPEPRRISEPIDAKATSTGRDQVSVAIVLPEHSVRTETVKDAGHGIGLKPVVDAAIEFGGIAPNTWQATNTSTANADDSKASTNLSEAQTGARLVNDRPFESANPQSRPLSSDTAAPSGLARPDAPVQERKVLAEMRTTTSDAEVARTSAESTALPNLSQVQRQGDLTVTEMQVDLTVTDKLNTEDGPISEVEVSALELKNVQVGGELKTPIAGLRPSDYPRQIALQVADIARLTPDKPMELVLNPEELGRLRVTFHSEATTMNVVLQFERPETLDLMRRHIDMLEQEMRDLGYESVNFTFEDQGGNDTGAEQKQKRAPPELPKFTPAIETATLNPIRVSLGDGAKIDIRI